MTSRTLSLVSLCSVLAGLLLAGCANESFPDVEEEALLDREAPDSEAELRPAQPTASRVQPERSFIFRGHVYVLQGDQLGVTRADDPTRTCGVYHARGFIRRMDGGNGALYLAEDGVGVEVVDLSDPCRPRFVRMLSTLSAATREARYVEVDGRQLFVSASENVAGRARWRVVAFDIADPLAPVLQTSFPVNTDGDGLLVRVGPDHIAVGGGAAGVVIYSISRGYIEGIISEGPLGGMVRRGSRLYVYSGAFDHVSLSVWNISRPGRPMLEGRVDVPDYAPYGDTNNLTITVRRGRVLLYAGASPPFLGFGPDTFLAFDATDPRDPRLLAQIPTTFTPGGQFLIPGDIDAVGDMAYVSGWPPPHFPPGYEYYVSRYDVSDPANPVRIDTTRVPARVLSPR